MLERLRPAAACVACLLAPLLSAASPAAAQEVVTQQEALRLAFPEPAEIQRKTAFLTDRELERARELAGGGVEVEQTVVTHYAGVRADSTLGVAYFDAHRVRTLREVLMVVVSPTGTVQRVEVLKFDEPREYRPPEGWLDEFQGVGLSGGSPEAGQVVNITGATLTSKAVKRAVRRILALHRVIAPTGGGDAADAGGRDDAGGADRPRSDRGADP